MNEGSRLRLGSAMNGPAHAHGSDDMYGENPTYVYGISRGRCEPGKVRRLIDQFGNTDDSGTSPIDGPSGWK
jgi:hypothetical protein